MRFWNDDAPVVVHVDDAHLSYGKTQALRGVGLELRAGRTLGLIGPDGVGKSSLLSLIAGARAVQQGQVEVLGGDMRRKKHRDIVCARIAFMPQGLGRNLYPTLSVEENLQFFARLFGHNAAQRRERIDRLTHSVGLYEFLDRPAGKLSGGMKQKTALCCALIHDPDLLILDEPTTGVDPLARAQFWDLIRRIRQTRPHMGVLIATAYMEEAQRFDHIAAMDDGQILASGTPQQLLARTGTSTLEAAFLELLPEAKKRGHTHFNIEPLSFDDNDIAIEAHDLTLRYGDFTAVDRVNLRIHRGEIFGFLGSNGCGKTSTMKMLTGLAPATEGKAWLFGNEVDANDMATRCRVGYMSQSFSLYTELSVKQNLVMHAQLFHVPQEQIARRVTEMMHRFGLTKVRHALPAALPLGIRQRLSLAVAMVHKPELLILDEPTSGVDPVARDQFWQYLVELSRRDRVTIFITTHFMNEAERCDRMSMMHAGKVLGSDAPAALKEQRGVATIEDVFIGYLVEATGESAPDPVSLSGPLQPSLASQPRSDYAIFRELRQGHENSHASEPLDSNPTPEAPARATSMFSLRRLWSYLWREALELQRDPVRASLALAGSMVLMVVISLGFSMDVEDLTFAVLDRDQSTQSEAYIRNLNSSRYFIQQPPIRNYKDLDRRMRSGHLSLAIEIPTDFGRHVARGTPVSVGAWFDGAMPRRGETIKGYVLGIHQHWLEEQSRKHPNAPPGSHVNVETRFHYNPDIKSLLAMVPAVIPLLLLMLPAMLTALSVVREKAMGSIVNLYVTPVSRIEFLVGKQLPYVALAMLNFFLMCFVAVYGFGIQMTGSLLLLTIAALLYSFITTGMGLLASAVTRSQIAAMFIASLGTLVPATQFSGLITPVSSLEGTGRIIGEIYPATHMFTTSRGVFSKALGMQDMFTTLLPMLISIPVILFIAVCILPKQER